MLAIKLQRIGKKHQPSYRLVVAEQRSKMAAPPVEDLGAYNPFMKVATFKKDRVAYWLKIGARPTVTAHNLLVAQGVVSAPKLVVKMKKKAVGEAAAPAPVASAAPVEGEAEAPAKPEAVAETKADEAKTEEPAA